MVQVTQRDGKSMKRKCGGDRTRTCIPFRAAVFKTAALPLCDPSTSVEGFDNIAQRRVVRQTSVCQFSATLDPLSSVTDGEIVTGERGRQTEVCRTFHWGRTEVCRTFHRRQTEVCRTSHWRQTEVCRTSRERQTEVCRTPRQRFALRARNMHDCQRFCYIAGVGGFRFQKSKTKSQRPKAKDQDLRPKTKDQRPKVKDQRPKAKDQRPKIKGQRPH